MMENVIQIKSGIMINVNTCAKNIIYVQKITFVIFQHVVAKMINTKQVFIHNLMIACDEIKNMEAKSCDEKTKAIPRNIIFETKSLYSLLAFILINIASLIAFSITLS